MVCQFCGKNPATIHFTEIKDGKKHELHICEACASEQGLAAGVPAVLGNLMQMDPPAHKRETSTEGLACPHCGITFDEFRTKGRLGCPHDYLVFAEALDSLVDKIHGAHRHTGRLPRGRRTVDTDLAEHLLRLRHELQESIRTEDYENAARLRDEIRALEGRATAPAQPGGEGAHGSG
ncbi:MAG: UvrB/UvrC motif-containing protein [Planctomycetota bacterium]